MIKKLLLLLLISGYIYADSLFVGPSFYYTNGSYSDDNSSRSLAFYNLLQVSQKYTLMMHYDNLLVSNPGWKLSQQGFAGGIIADYFPFYFKVNFGHYMGKYKYTGSQEVLYNEYADYNNIYNLDFIYLKDWNYTGLSYTYMEGENPDRMDNHQLTFRFDKFVSAKLLVSIKPAAIVNDQNVLYSAAVKLHYYASEHFILRGGGFAGERAYYFDPDLILFYNQNDIQRYQFFGQLEYVLSNQIALVTNYSHTSFNNFSINYFVAGIRTGFWL